MNYLHRLDNWLYPNVHSSPEPFIHYGVGLLDTIVSVRWWLRDDVQHFSPCRWWRYVIKIKDTGDTGAEWQQNAESWQTSINNGFLQNESQLQLTDCYLRININPTFVFAQDLTIIKKAKWITTTLPEGEAKGQQLILQIFNPEGYFNGLLTAQNVINSFHSFVLCPV